MVEPLKTLEQRSKNDDTSLSWIKLSQKARTTGKFNVNEKHICISLYILLSLLLNSIFACGKYVRR